MPNIGNYDFVHMSGDPVPKLSSAVETFVRKGVDGVGFRTTSLQSRLVQKQTVQWFRNETDALDAVDDYAECKGLMFRITEETGRRVDGILVVDVVTKQPQQIANTIPAGFYWQVTAIWQLQPTRK